MDKIVPETKLSTKRRQKRPKKPFFGTCEICGDKAPKQQHYGCKAEVCYSCRAFFRRCVNKNINPLKIQCNSFLIKVGSCQIKPETRSLCRYAKKFSSKWLKIIGNKCQCNVNIFSRTFFCDISVIVDIKNAVLLVSIQTL